MAALTEENKKLAKRLEKATEEPPTRASQTYVVDTEKKTQRRLFPAVYNDPIHDPDVSATS